MIKVPPYLFPGNTIGMVCPAGYMPPGRVEDCISSLEAWGYKVQIGNTVTSASHNYFSGTDDERLADLQHMLDNDEVHAILCARGGYGLSRIIDRINFKKFRKHPKWIIGFSDVTVLHAHIYARYGIATMHAPMAAAFIENKGSNRYIQSLRKALSGGKIRYRVHGHEFNRKGEAVGELVGGNLALLAHLCGTPSEIKTKGRILFLEDVGEYLYNIDRMLHQLKRCGKLNKLAGLIIGGFTDNKDTERPFGKTAYEIIHDIVREYQYPVCFGFPVSHEKENYALKVGIGYKLTVRKNKVVLEE